MQSGTVTFPLINIDRTADKPIFAQVSDELVRAIEGGELKVGARLPPVRSMATQLNINSLTVARAYRELAAQGILVGRGARGTFVNGERAQSVADSGKSPFVQADDGEGKASIQRKKSELRDADTFRRMLDLTSLPGTIPLTQSYPDRGAMDTSHFEGCIRAVLDEHPEHLYTYSSPDGLPMLREAFVDLVAASGITTTPDNIVVTNGGQQSMNLVVRSLIAPGDVVLVERPSYFGAIDLFRSAGATMVGIDLLSDGPDVEQLEKAIKETSPKLIFLMPTFQNPTGITTSLEKRQAIVKLCQKYKIAIIEDDHCPEIRFSGKPLPPLRALGEVDDPIFYVRGMGKAYVPGIRLGFIVAPPSWTNALITQKAITDLHVSPLIQNAFARYLADPGMQPNLTAMTEKYKKIQATVLKLLKRHLPEGSSFTRPEGGFNIWIDLPRGTDLEQVCWAAARLGAGVLMGSPLFPDQTDRATLRLSYGLSDLDTLTIGVERLCMAIKDVGGTRTRTAHIVV